VEYRTDLFDESTVATMVKHFERVLSRLIADGDQLIDTLSLLDESELYPVLGLDPDEYDYLLPLTPVQRDMLLNAQINPETRSNNVGYVVNLAEEVDADLYKAGLQEMYDRQSTLRTEIITNTSALGEMAYQAVLKKREAHLEVIDLGDQDLSNEELLEMMDDRIYVAFEYRKGVPLLHNYLIKVKQGWRHLCVACHIMMDGMATTNFGVSALHLYGLLLNNESTDDIHVEDNFKDYVTSIRQKMDNLDVQTFWKDKLQNAEALDFPIGTDHFGDDGPKRVAKLYEFDDAHWAEVKSFCRRNKITPQIYLKCLYGLLISAYCRPEKDFSVAEFNAGRDKQFMFNMGNYYQQSPFVFPRELLQAESSIGDLFSYARGFQKAIKGQILLSSMAQRRFVPQGRLTFMYNYYHFLPDPTFLGKEVKKVDYAPLVENAVQLVCKTEQGRQQLVLYYDQSCFHDHDLLQRFALLSEQLVAGTQAIADLRFVTETEQQQQLTEWNQTAVAMPEPESLQQWFEQQVEATPDNVAVIAGDQQQSYRELNQRANQLAHYLRDNGVGHDIRVGVCLSKSIDTMVAIMGVIKAGGAYIPMDADYPKERLAYMLEDSGAPILLTESCLLERLPEHNGQTLCVNQDSDDWQTIVVCDDSNPEHHTTLDHQLYAIYTSGSTGQPKGAGVVHRGELNLLNWYLREFAIGSEDKNLLISALGFDLTQKNLFATLLTGGAIVMPEMDHYDPQEVARLVEKEKITLVNCAPSAFYQVVEETTDLKQLASLRYLILGGEPIRVERFQAWLEHDSCQARLVNNYGPTECTDIAAFFTVNDPTAYYHNTLPVGRPNDNVQLYLLNDNNQLLPTGIAGELCIAGNGVGIGYHNRSDLTAEKFIDNPFGDGKLYRTGDLMRYLDDGKLEFIGRKDFQVKVRGLRIELGEIEFALRQQEGVQDVLVTVDNERLVAYAMGDTEAMAVDSWRGRLMDYLPNYMVPNLFIPLDEWPLTPNGKIDRKALPDADSIAKRSVEYVAPRDDVEEQLARIWSDVLGVEKVGIHDDFFELGGHSLMASRAVTQFREAFEMEIPLKVLFEMTTIAQIASYVKATKWAEQAAEKQDTVDEGENRDEGFI